MGRRIRLAAALLALVVARPCAAGSGLANPGEVARFQKQLSALRAAPNSHGASLLAARFVPGSHFHGQVVGILLDCGGIDDPIAAYTRALAPIQTLGRRRINRSLEHAASRGATLRSLHSNAETVAVLGAFGLADEVNGVREIAQAGKRALYLARIGADYLLYHQPVGDAPDVLVKSARQLHLSLPAVQLGQRKIPPAQIAQKLGVILEHAPLECDVFAKIVAQLMVAAAKKAEDERSISAAVRHAVRALKVQKRRSLAEYLAAIVDIIRELQSFKLRAEIQRYIMWGLTAHQWGGLTDSANEQARRLLVNGAH